MKLKTMDEYSRKVSDLLNAGWMIRVPKSFVGRELWTVQVTAPNEALTLMYKETVTPGEWIAATGEGYGPYGSVPIHGLGFRQLPDGTWEEDTPEGGG